MSLTLVFSLTCYSVTQLELTKRIKEMDSKNTTPSQKNLVVLRFFYSLLVYSLY